MSTSDKELIENLMTPEEWKVTADAFGKMIPVMPEMLRILWDLSEIDVSNPHGVSLLKKRAAKVLARITDTEETTP